MNKWELWVYQLDRRNSKGEWAALYEVECQPRFFRQLLTFTQHRHSAEADTRLRRVALRTMKGYRFNGNGYEQPTTGEAA